MHNALGEIRRDFRKNKYFKDEMFFSQYNKLLCIKHLNVLYKNHI